MTTHSKSKERRKKCRKLHLRLKSVGVGTFVLTQISSWLSSKLLSISFDASLKNAKVIVRIGYGDPKMSIKMLNISYRRCADF